MAMKRLTACAVAVALGGCLADVPAYVRHERVKTLTAVDGFSVVANPEGPTAWRIDVRNDTDQMATVVWDESTFVTAAGQSAGRLISGDTMVIDVTRSHPATPVAPHASVAEIVFPEAFVEDTKLEARLAGRAEENGGRLHRDEADLLNRSRARRDERVIGGKLYVTIQGATGKVTWSGDVVETK